MLLSERIKHAGIVGCGGAGFPTHLKYSGGPIETIIINGAECEPLLGTDRYLMREQADLLIDTADRMMEETKAALIIALKREYEQEIQALEQAISEKQSRVRLHKMDAFFPAGDEQTMVCEVTGRVVPPAGIPMDVGCVVTNIATLTCIGDAYADRPFTDKYMTVTGEVANPMIIKVPIGTPVKTCLELAGGPLISDYVIVNGGPMMGRMIKKEDVEQSFVTKTMSGLIVLPADSDFANRRRVSLEHMIHLAKSACIQCSFCSELCPRALLGHPIRPNRIMRKVSSGTPVSELLHETDIVNAALCCECGICEVYACPMGLQPRTINGMIKKELSKAGIRYQKNPDASYREREERSTRKAPTARVANRAGVAKYEHYRLTDFKECQSDQVPSVTLSLSQGIGAPSIPVVCDKERVERGQLIARCPEGKLGSELHASKAGTVRLDGGSVTIIS